LKKHLTKGFLWLVFLFEIGILLVVFLLYILSDPKTLQYAVDRATGGLGVSYENISGNFLKTMTIYKLRYKDRLLASEAEIDWNLRALINGEIEIETLSLKNVNLSNIEEIIQHAQQNSSKNSLKKNQKKHLSIPEISISHLFLSTLPYHSKYINIENLELEIYDISSDLEHLKIKEFSIETDNDYANLQASGEVKKEVLHLKHLNVKKIDIDKIITLSQNLTKRENNSTQPFTLFKEVVIDTAHIETASFSYPPYQLTSLTLDTKGVKSLIKPLTLSVDKLSLKGDTNLGSLSLLGKIKENHFQGETTLNLSQKYFQQYTKIIDFASLNPIHAALDFNQSSIDATLNLKSKQIFDGRYKSYLVAINTLKSHLHYDLTSNHLKAITDANITTKYASSLLLKDNLTYDGNLSYGGTIKIDTLEKFPEYSLPLFQDAIIHYQADAHTLTANLETSKLHLLYKMYDYKRADFTLDSKALEIAKYFPKIPTPLHPLKAKLQATMALDFHHALPIMIENNITSNAINIRGKTMIEHAKVVTKATTTLSKNSFLPSINSAIKLHNIFPSKLEIGYSDKNLQISLATKQPQVTNSFYYDFNTSILKNTLTLGEDTIQLEGISDRLQLNTHTYSLKTLQEKLIPLYQFKYEPYDGEVELNATIENLQKVVANINSRWLVYEYKPNRFAFAEKIKMQAEIDANQATINHYFFSTYLDYDRQFYATKPSVIEFGEKKISLLSLWVNDKINNQGSYDFKTQKGLFHTKTTNYHYKGEEGDVIFDASLDTTLHKNKTDVEGFVNIKKGVITYQHRKTHDIQDPDIIIIQEEEARKRAKEEKKNDLSIDISIYSKKPLTYKVPKIEVSFVPDIKIWKEAQKEVELLGRMIINNGHYIESEKEFSLLAGEVLFGGDVLNPYLNLRAQYSSKPYIIDIDVTGTLDSPIVNFSSTPYLSQSDILSMLLFSATTESLFEGSSSSSNQAISMLGNTFAKEIVKNFGLSLDKLVISTNEEGGLGIEIGKKISKKITVIYINDIVQSIKVRYQHSNNFETDLMLSPESSGIDFLYKSEH
jgi:translocation and assembly module TamB